MKKEIDYNQVAKIEKAIKEKYGDEAIQNPKSSWDEDKEKAYLDELKAFYNKKNQEKSRQDKDGFTVVERKNKQNKERTCPVCSSYSTKNIDDLYMLKFQCCFNCYIQYVEGREERWKTGWRPNK